MAEQYVEVVPYGVNYICDECRVGHMVFTKRFDHSAPVEKACVHKCTHCGTEQLLSDAYPTVRFRFQNDKPIDITKN